MTTELVLLFSLFAFLLLGAFLGDSGPSSVFANSTPHLAARIEQQLSTGHSFRGTPDNQVNPYFAPAAGPPGSGL